MSFCDEGSLVIFWAGSMYEGTPFLGMFLFRVLGRIQQARIDENLLLETSDSCSSDLVLKEASHSKSKFWSS